MKIRTLFLLLVLALIVGFVALNWEAFAAPTTLSIGVMSFEAPLGFIMLGLVAALTATLLGYVIYLQRSATAAEARHARKLEAQRELADRAEASRFTQLREFMAEEWRRQEEREEQFRNEILVRMQRVESERPATTPRHSHADGEERAATLVPNG